MCECSGLTLIPEKSRNPLKTTSYGTGELIRKAVLSGKKKIYITLGGGAAGGMGAGLSVMLNAKIVSGVEEILNIVNFDETINDADYIITGEGKIDGQSKDGKVISGVLNHSKAKNIPVIAIVGKIGNGYETLYNKGLTSVFSIIDKPSHLQDVLTQSEELYKSTARNILRLLK